MHCKRPCCYSTGIGFIYSAIFECTDNLAKTAFVALAHLNSWWRLGQYLYMLWVVKRNVQRGWQDPDELKLK